MTKNIFLCHGDITLFREILTEISLKEKNILFKGMFSTGDKDLPSVNKTDSFTLYDFINGKKKYYTNNNLTPDEINYFRKECFYGFISQSDRLSINSIPATKKIKLFDQFVSYFLEYFKNNKITHVVFHTTPHLAFDFIFFHIAHFLKLEKIIFFRTYYEDMTLISKDYRKNNFMPLVNQQQELKIEIMKKNISAWGKLGKSINKASTQSNNFTGIINFLIILLKKLKYAFINRQLQSYNLLNTKNNIFSFIYIHFYHLFHTYSLKKKYLQLCKKIDYSTDYVFFAMHNQPEKTTSPEGQEFDNQINAIKLLRKIINKNIKIYVKEHPKQLSPFTGDVRQINSRSIDDYLMIDNLENCELLDISIDTSEIIKSAKINFTISGTLAWQSLLNNVPTMTFSNTWHSNCRSSPVIKNDFSQAIDQVNELLQKKKEDVVNDLKLFQENIRNKLFFTSISEFEIKKSSNKEGVLKDNLYKAFISII